LINNTLVPQNESGIEKVFHTIGEVAGIIGVTPSTIRYWEDNFPALAPQKNKKGTRLFTPEDIETVKLIHYLVKTRGMTLRGARKKLKENKEETVQNWEIVQRLQLIKKELQEIKAKMEE